MRFPNALDEAKAEPLARRTVESLRRPRRSMDLRLARAFARIDDSRHFLIEGCASLGEWGERMGYSASESRIYARAGRVLAHYPWVGGRVLLGRLSLEAVAVLERVLRDESLARPEDDRIGWAEQETVHALRNRVKRRLEEARTGSPTVEVTVHLSPDAKSDLDRSRELLGGSERRLLTESETVERLAGYYLDREDPVRRAPGTRRAGDTAGHPGRHVPEEVRREIRARASRSGILQCEAPGCDETHGLQFAHLESHCDDGSREVENLVLFCKKHHDLFDAGWLEVFVWEGTVTVTRLIWQTRAGRERERARRRRGRPPHERRHPCPTLAREWKWTRMDPDAAHPDAAYPGAREPEASEPGASETEPATS
jgi:hypothetical protein